MLDLRGRLVVVVGGGVVAVRKVRGLLACGADRIRVVSPDFHPSLPQAPGIVERIIGRYEGRHLDGAGLVFAATGSAEVNAAVVSDAHEAGLLVNRADAVSDDDASAGDFSTPARFEAGPVVVTVSCGNAALSAQLRDELRARFDPSWRQWAEAAVTLRPLVTSHPAMSQADRAQVLRDLSSPEALARLQAGGEASLIEWVVERHPAMGPVLQAARPDVRPRGGATSAGDVDTSGDPGGDAARI